MGRSPEGGIRGGGRHYGRQGLLLSGEAGQRLSGYPVQQILLHPEYEPERDGQYQNRPRRGQQNHRRRLYDRGGIDGTVWRYG